jgi:protein-tyrosine phosphatase
MSTGTSSNQQRREPYRVIVVCTGNICRSPMGELILRERLEEAGLGDRVEVDSAGTSAWEVGNPADRRTLEVLRRNGHPDVGGADHVARQFDHSWINGRDLILAADSGHLDDLRRMARTDEQRSRIRLFREFDPEAVAAGELDMDDPWYGDGTAFDQTYAEVTAAAAGVVEHVRAELAARDGEVTTR